MRVSVRSRRTARALIIALAGLPLTLASGEATAGGLKIIVGSGHHSSHGYHHGYRTRQGFSLNYGVGGSRFGLRSYSPGHGYHAGKHYGLKHFGHGTKKFGHFDHRGRIGHHGGYFRGFSSPYSGYRGGHDYRRGYYDGYRDGRYKHHRHQQGHRLGR